LPEASGNGGSLDSCFLNDFVPEASTKPHDNKIPMPP
jgi:hypothetical protein